MHLRTVLLSVGASILGLALIGAEPAPQASSPTPGKSYQIRNKKFGDLLRPKDANSAAGTPMVLYSAQPWKCMTWKVSSGGDSRFFLQNHFTSKTFAANTARSGNSRVSQVPWGKSAEERPAWQFTKLSDGTYKLSDVKTGLVLTAARDADGSGVTTTTQAWAERDDQKWELLEIDPKALTM